MKLRTIAMAVPGCMAALAAVPVIHAAEICTAIADAATGKVMMQRGDCRRQVTPASNVSSAILARDGLIDEFPALINAIEVDQAIQPLLQRNDIPGMAVALSVNGKHYFYNYGVASRETGQAVSNATLFEIGSLSKTLTATLATYAQAQGKLAMTDPVSRHVPYLRGSNFDNINLIHLGTNTVGDFPMQVPQEIKTYDQLMNYYKNWKPGHAAGTHRTYSNLGIGLLSIATAASLGVSYVDAVEKTLFPALGMTHSYIKVPAGQMAQYAQGYNSKGAPVRMNPDVLADEAYGVKSNTRDLIRFLDANMGLVQLDANLARAVADTHTGYFKTGVLTQDLIWEQYPGQAGLEQLLAGTAVKMSRESNPVSIIDPPLPPQADAWLHKTGSTGGFSAYALYNPARRVGIVMLSNRFFPSEQRVSTAYGLLNRLAPAAP